MPDALAVSAGLLIDGAGEAHAARHVHVAGGRVASITTELGDAREVLDASAYTVMPGIIDTHVHLFNFFDLDDADKLAHFVNSPDGIQRTLEQLLAHGVTTVRSLCDPEDEVLDVRARLTDGSFCGPRLLAVGPGITAIGGHPASTATCCNPFFRVKSTTEVDSVEGIRATVRRLAGKGVDGIKLFFDGAMVGEAPVRFDSDALNIHVEVTCFDTSVLAAAIDEAHQRGLRVTVHVKNVQRARAAVECGVDTLEHVFGLTSDDADFVKALIDANVSVAPTLISGPHRDEAYTAVKHLHENGVGVVLGSDCNPVSGVWGNTSIREIEAMHRAGMSTAAVIRASTAAAARHIGREHDLGSLEPGHLADFLVLDGNPLEDLSALRRIVLVVQAGNVVVDNRKKVRA